jgi:hypothetical protein
VLLVEPHRYISGAAHLGESFLRRARFVLARCHSVGEVCVEVSSQLQDDPSSLMGRQDEPGSHGCQVLLQR